MSKEQSAVSLEAKSPFELRVNMGRNVAESAVKAALVTGNIGFLHSFTTGSAVDGPGIRVVGWTAGCHWKCQYCHNPDTWNLMNGVPRGKPIAFDPVTSLELLEAGLPVAARHVGALLTDHLSLLELPKCQILGAFRS